MNQHNLIISATCGDKVERKKKRNPTLEKYYIPSMVHPLLNLKSIHHASEFC
jgi:hypothetical protein